MKNDLIVPDEFEDEALNQISNFDTEGLMRDMNSYFIPVDEESIFFFIKEMSDKFIEEAVAFIEKIAAL